MSTDSSPESSILDLAKTLTKSAEAGNTEAATEILKQAAVGLRSVLDGSIPDPERVEYLRYILRAIDEINSGVEPGKALGIATDSRPIGLRRDGDFAIFIEVGREFRRLSKVGVEAPVKLAKTNVAARKTGKKNATITKAWEKFGGLTGWQRIEPDIAE